MKQINEITHWLDSSNVYGSTNAVLDTLRDGVNGLLKTDLYNSEELLPQNSAAGCGSHTEYGANCPMERCFLAGT